MGKRVFKSQAGRKRTPEQKIAEKAARGRRDQQRIRDASNKSKKKNPEPNIAASRKVIMRCSMMLLMCPLQRSQVAQVMRLASGVVAGFRGKAIKPESYCTEYKDAIDGHPQRCSGCRVARSQSLQV